jgi:ribulose-phosphate 3-epimerase
MSKVVPAILTQDPEALETMVRQAESFTDYVQIDIMDGQFVPSQSITSEHLAALSMQLNWEAHLMVQHPEDYLAVFKQIGAKKIIFHYETTSSPRNVIQQAKALALEVGLAINPETPLSSILPLISEVDSVLFLTVHPGFYGSQFLPEVLNKLAELHTSRPEVKIGVDGGIKEHNIATVASAGADIIYVGSAIFLQPKPGESFRHLAALAKENPQ